MNDQLLSNCIPHLHWTLAQRFVEDVAAGDPPPAAGYVEFSEDEFRREVELLRSLMRNEIDFNSSRICVAIVRAAKGTGESVRAGPALGLATLGSCYSSHLLPVRPFSSTSIEPIAQQSRRALEAHSFKVSQQGMNRWRPWTAVANDDIVDSIDRNWVELGSDPKDLPHYATLTGRLSAGYAVAAREWRPRRLGHQRGSNWLG
jgi:hypothetical protein